jgi:peptidoglycan/LPS O-acetylase OafA/YrhL
MVFAYETNRNLVAVSWLCWGVGYYLFLARSLRWWTESDLANEGRNVVRLMANLGVFSYSIYLVHSPVIYWMRNVPALLNEVSPTNLFACTALILPCLAAAWLFYRVIELPSHRWARHWVE